MFPDMCENRQNQGTGGGGDEDQISRAPTVPTTCSEYQETGTMPGQHSSFTACMSGGCPVPRKPQEAEFCFLFCYSCQVTQKGRGIAIHFQTNQISSCSVDKSPPEVSSKGSCDVEAEEQSLAQVPRLPPAVPPSCGESIPRPQRGTRTEQAPVTLCQAK